MNTRVLDLIKNPDLFQPDDLRILENEISKAPYVQSFRALQLYGIHRFQPEDYAAKLSETAAFTTDKKILYRFINKKTETLPVTHVIPSAEAAPVKKDETKLVAVEPAAVSKPKPVYVNGELNRILFEGEEDFMNQEQETIDLESTVESGILTTQKTESKPIEIQSNKRETEENPAESFDAEDFSKEVVIDENQIQNEQKEIEKPVDLSFEEIADVVSDTTIKTEEKIFAETPIAESFSKEIIIDEEGLQQEKKKVENSADLNFHGTSDFMPDVKISVPTIPETLKPVPKPIVNRHEEEMQRLIAEVEEKMKTSKKNKQKVETEPVQNAEINFAQTESFMVAGAQSSSVEEEKSPALTSPSEMTNLEKEKPKATLVSPNKENGANKEEEPKLIKTTISEEKPAWKPMPIATHLPDSVIGLREEKVQQAIIKQPEKEDRETPILKEKTEERAAFNVSFFTPEVARLEEKKAEEQDEKEATESNVPVFINTWQNWLKIDRGAATEKKPIVSKAEQKIKSIENFIENEPKISKLKDDSDFVVKDKGDNIQHLMTETLARLYTEQKLYAKAIKAYEILGEKHPEKKTFFSDKIQEVKDLRQNKSQ